MNLIIPAIIPTSREHLLETLAVIQPFTRAVQVDIVDGVFVPFTSWPYSEGGAVLDIQKDIEGFDIEVDLMVMNPEDVIVSYLEAGATSVVVHLESTEKLGDIVALKSQYNFKLGFSINNDTSFETLTDVLEHAEYVQLMGIAKIGSQGQPFDTRVLERISTLKVLSPELMVSIDGSVNLETLPQLIKAGADRFVSGSAILSQESPQDAYETLTQI
jgi:ribulose-phosphate 3-epimerase